MPTPDTAMNLLKNVRKYIFEHFEEHAIAPVLEQITQKFGLDRASAFNVLVELQSARHIVLTCSNNMVFFSSKDQLAEWMRTVSVTGGEALNIDQTLRLSLPIYKEKMSLDYARPSREQTIAHFQSLGLTGDFWKI